MRRAVIALLAVVSALSAAAPVRSPGNPLIGNEIGVDHILLWSKDNRAGEAALDRLGFTLTEKPGSYGAGISNKLVWFGNWSFIEFLWLSDPARAKAEAAKEHAFATTTNGSNGFGISVRDADETYRTLAAARLDPDQPGAEAYDPDGPGGPKPPVVNQWRFMFLKDGALAGNPFFVEYKTKAQGERSKRHPNGARRLSAVWILVDDAAKAAADYAGAAFHGGRRIEFASLGLTGVALVAGQGEIFLLQPGRAGPYRTALQRRGAHVFGISLQVFDLDATQQLLQARLGSAPRQHSGPYRRAFIPPVQPPLGLTIAFHD